MFGQWESLGQQQVGPGEMFPIPGSESPGGLNVIPGTPFGDCFLATHGTPEDEQSCIHQTTSSSSTSATLFGSTFLRNLFGGGTAVRPAGSDTYTTVPDSVPDTGQSGFQLTSFGAILAIGVLAFFLLKR